MPKIPNGCTPGGLKIVDEVPAGLKEVYSHMMEPTRQANGYKDYLLWL